MAFLGGLFMMLLPTKRDTMLKCIAFACISHFMFWKMPVVAEDPPETSSVQHNPDTPPAMPAAATAASAGRPRRSPLVDYSVSVVGGGGRVPPPPPTTAEEAAKQAIEAGYRYNASLVSLETATYNRHQSSTEVDRLTELVSNDATNDELAEQLESATAVLDVYEAELIEANNDVVAACAEFSAARDTECALSCTGPAPDAASDEDAVSLARALADAFVPARSPPESKLTFGVVSYTTYYTVNEK
jgi:hypothetical protein